MKKIIPLLLAFVLLLSLSACTVTSGTGGSLRVGQKIEGFVVKETRDFPLVGAQIYFMEHEKTGAELVYIANNDTNRVFNLTFFTRAIDNTGLPHVFEHSTLDGSEKYPSKSLFFNLSYQTYNTYMNAMTAPLYTTYPVASLSEEQLLKYADYYTDSCLHPLILEDESIFREEAWRYRLADAESDLTIEGTVYSEMLGATSINSEAYRNLLRTAFPGSTIGNVSGGDPAFIPDMTWESLRSYHDLYYHPSNCCAFLYGEFENYTAFLKILNEAFSPYEKREFSFEENDYTPITDDAVNTYKFPSVSGTVTENASIIYYGIMCPGLKDDPNEEMIYNTLTDLLNSDGSPLMQNLKRAIPRGSFGSYIEIDGPEDMITFAAVNVNEDIADTFVETVNSSLAEIAETGFSADLVDAVMNSVAMSVRLTGESSDIGVDLIDSFVSYYASRGIVFGYADYVDAMGKFEQWNSEGLYVKAISDRLLDPEITVLSITAPDPGAREKLDAKEKERLAGVKAAMTPDELQAIIDTTNSEVAEDDASSYVKALQAVTVASLPEEIREYDVSERMGEDGVQYIDAIADVDGIGDIVLLLDASSLPQKDILWFHLYTDLLGELDTAKHDRDSLALLTGRYLYNGEIRMSLAVDGESGLLIPRLRAGWISTDEDLETGYSLMHELLYETDFSDSETIANLIGKYKDNLKDSINSSPYTTMLYRTMGSNSELYRYYNYFNGIEYYQFLEETEKTALETPGVVKLKLENIRNFFNNRSGASAVFAGNEESIALNAQYSADFFSKLDETPRKRADYSLPSSSSFEALIVDSNVQFNGVVADYETLGMDEYSGSLDAVSSIVSDKYLYPMLRDQYGAYGVMTGFIEDYGAYIVSYRDPNIVETYEVYQKLPDFLSTLEIDQEELDGYILSAYSYYAKSAGELSGAVSAAFDTLLHTDSSVLLDYMRDLKSITVEKLQDYADVYAKLVSEGMRFTAGSSSAISANEDFFDTVLSPFAGDELILEDVGEGLPHYDAVSFVLDYNLMYPATKTTFGVDAPATKGDAAIALYALGIEDIKDPDQAISELASFGIFSSSDLSSDPLTGADFENCLSVFSSLVGVSYEKTEAENTAVTRGELAEMIMEYTLPLLG
jgi:Zn-dependent M16 (insulinase) family peptidase